MTHISTDEACIGIVIPVRLLPQLMALLAVATDAGQKKPCVETTAVEPRGPGISKTVPYASTLKRVGGWG